VSFGPSVDGLVNVFCYVSQGRTSIASSPPEPTRSAAKVPPCTFPLRLYCSFLILIGVVVS
jgi:hypothetical protein